MGADLKLARHFTSILALVLLCACSYSGLNVEGRACDHAHPCPSGYVCVSGGTDGQSTCRPELICQSNEDCDDSNACTADFCISNTCQHSDFPNGLNCDDHDPCTSLDRCESGSCLGAARDCSAFDGVCFQGDCDPESGACQAFPREEVVACDDGQYCTEGDLCSAGVCQGTARGCDDNDPCTRDSCNEGEDVCDNLIEPLPGQEGILVDGSCGNLSDDDCDGLTDLEDPNCLACTQDGECDDSNPCTGDSCIDEVCSNQVLADDSACDDLRFCTVNDRCLGGVCTGDPRDCSAAVPICQAPVCQEASGQCGYLPEPDGTPCDDGQYCTVADECLGSDCVGAVRDCDDGDFCTLDSCLESTSECLNEMAPIPGSEGPPGTPNCQNQIDDDCDGLTDNLDPNCMDCSQDSECDDDNPCTADSCQTNLCRNDPLPQGTDCDDGLYCNGQEQCDDGSCLSSGDPCGGSSECSSTCNEQQQRCDFPVGAPCGDPTDAPCDLADSCDDQGTCLDNLLPAGDRCDGDDLVACDGQGGWNLVETCPLGCNSEDGRCNLLNPSNINPTLLCAGIDEFDPDDYTGNGIFCINTDDESQPFYHCFDWVPLAPYQPSVVNVVSQTGGPDIMVLSFTSIYINADFTIYATGSRALALASCGDATIRGKLIAAGDNGLPGAGGGVGGDARSHGDGLGYDGYGRWQSAPAQPSPGGGGAGFGAGGGDGGYVGGPWNDPGGQGGNSFGNHNLVPLIGGAGGGGGDDEWPVDGHNSLGGRGGEGGGGLQISCGGHMLIEPGGVLGAPGLAGEAAWALNNTFGAGGGGGGAGGGILLEALSIQIDGTLAANGGGGGGGGTGAAMDGEHGRLDAVPAGGGYGADSANGSYGGDGGAGSTPDGLPGEDHDTNTGGGGGAAGRIRLNTPTIEDLTLGADSIISPSQTPGPPAQCTGLCSKGTIDLW